MTGRVAGWAIVVALLTAGCEIRGRLESKPAAVDGSACQAVSRDFEAALDEARTAQALARDAQRIAADSQAAARASNALSAKYAALLAARREPPARSRADIIREILQDPDRIPCLPVPGMPVNGCSESRERARQRQAEPRVEVSPELPPEGAPLCYVDGNGNTRGTCTVDVNLAGQWKTIVSAGGVRLTAWFPADK